MWSRDVALFTDGPAGLEAADRSRLDSNGVPLYEERVAALVGTDGILERIELANGTVVGRRALFFVTREHQHSPLAERLGCSCTRQGAVRTKSYEDTEVPGLYVAGDASRSVQMVIIAAAEGAEAAAGINTALSREDLR